jgi:predicted transcriptional regulator
MQELAPAAPYVDIIDLTADLVRAHVSRSDVPPELLRTLILEIHGTLRALAEPEPAGAELPIPMTPGAVLASPEARAEVVTAAYEAREVQAPPPPPELPPEIRVPEPASAQEHVRAPETPRSARVRALKPVSIPKPLAQLPDEDAPAVEPERSLTPDAVIDLEGGKPHRDLGRFIADARGEDPDAYRRRFGLPKEYPMMAPRLIRTRGRVSELDPVTFRRLSIGPVERDARFDGEAS